MEVAAQGTLTAPYVYGITYNKDLLLFSRKYQAVIPGGGGLTVRDVMRACPDNVHDLHCRDRFRMELTRTSVHLYANGYPIMLIDGLFAVNPATGADNRIPQSWIDNASMSREETDTE